MYYLIHTDTGMSGTVAAVNEVNAESKFIDKVKSMGITSYAMGAIIEVEEVEISSDFETGLDCPEYFVGVT